MEPKILLAGLMIAALPFVVSAGVWLMARREDAANRAYHDWLKLAGKQQSCQKCRRFAMIPYDTMATDERGQWFYMGRCAHCEHSQLLVVKTLEI